MVNCGFLYLQKIMFLDKMTESSDKNPTNYLANYRVPGRRSTWFNDAGISATWQDYCSDPTCRGRNYILIWVFFVRTILADRYIHCREM